MSRTSKHHHELNEQGEGRCSVPMWCGGLPADFCDRPAYGERPPSPTYWDGYTTRRTDGRYDGYVPGLACPIHGGPSVRTFKDGNAWCAVHPDFIDLQASPAGFGDTPQEAIANLKQARP